MLTPQTMWKLLGNRFVEAYVNGTRVTVRDTTRARVGYDFEFNLLIAYTCGGTP
jgi:hypothetical protein